MKLLGIAGNARSGKDTFCELFSNYVLENGLISRRVAFADQMKAELYDFCQENFGFSSFTEDKEQKDILRPIFVAYGCAKRKLSNGLYWVNKVDATVNSLKKGDLVDICVITDVRFKEQDFDESDWLIKKGGDLLFLEREENGSIIPPANNYEKDNNKKLKEIAKFKICWNNINIGQVITDFAKEYTKELIYD